MINIIDQITTKYEQVNNYNIIQVSEINNSFNGFFFLFALFVFGFLNTTASIWYTFLKLNTCLFF